MMRVAVFACVIAVSSAAVLYGPLAEMPERYEGQSGCYIQETDQVVHFGETVYPIGHCYRIHCSEHALDYASCGVVSTDDPNCSITEKNLTKPYPDCCPDVKCNQIFQDDY